MVASPYVSALLRFAPHPVGASIARPCVEALPVPKQNRRERIFPFRLPRFCLHPPVGLTQKLYRHQRKGASKCLPLAELEGKMPLAADEV